MNKLYCLQYVLCYQPNSLSFSPSWSNIKNKYYVKAHYVRPFLKTTLCSSNPSFCVFFCIQGRTSKKLSKQQLFLSLSPNKPPKEQQRNVYFLLLLVEDTYSLLFASRLRRFSSSSVTPLCSSQSFFSCSNARRRSSNSRTCDSSC